MEGYGLDMLTQQWMATKIGKNGEMSRANWNKNRSAMLKMQFDEWFNESRMLIPVPGQDVPYLPIQMWVFTQGCFAAESYWTALNMSP